MHFLVLGATGAIGSRFCEIALKEGHTLSLFVRNRNRIPSWMIAHAEATIIEGTLEDESALEKASSCGAEIFVTFAGPPAGSTGTPLASGYKALIPKLMARNFLRIFVLGTPSFHSDADNITFKWRLGIWTIRLLSAGQYREILAIGEYISSLPKDSETEYTFFRVGGLTNGNEAPVQATHLGSGKDAMWIGRASVARWVLNEAEEKRWIGKMPYICN
ncbi:hypothetical protein N7512_001657 [Penicillium capsulatum]|nr:hypothetical protein N7512_001657 [Penicillium capsulatum]